MTVDMQNRSIATLDPMRFPSVSRSGKNSGSSGIVWKPDYRPPSSGCQSAPRIASSVALVPTVILLGCRNQSVSVTARLITAACLPTSNLDVELL